MPDTDTRLRDLLVALVSHTSRFTRRASSFGSESHPRSWMRALSLLDEYGDVRISDFARIDRCSQPSATALLQKLTDHGLVSRRADPDDSRAVIVGITDAGRDWMSAGRTAIADAMAPHFADLAPEQIERLSDGLAELRTILSSPTF